MPFTPTHILAVVPVAHRWASPGVFSALCIGSMVPDWPLYFPVGPTYQLTHSLPGVFIACLPVGLVITWLFLAVARRPLFELASPGLRQRLAGYLNSSPERSARGILITAVAICVGAATHIIWDSFTHRNTWGVAMFPALKDVWITVFGVRFVGYMALQHGSSLIGLPLMLLLYFRWYRLAECQSVPDQVISPVARWFWILLLFGIPLAVMIRHIAVIPQFGLHSLIIASYYGVTEAGFLITILIACYSLLFYPVVKYRQEKKA